MLRRYRHDRFKAPPSEPRADVDALIVSAHDDVSSVVAEAEIVATAVNWTRDLQNAPPNEMAPRHLAHAARELGSLEGVTVEVDGRAGIVARGMGSFAAVAQGADEEPALITIRYEGPDASGPVLGLVGKAVTFDTGGISIKAREQDVRDEVRHVRRRGACSARSRRSPSCACRSGSSPSSARPRTCRRATRCAPATSCARPTT